jgi:hypothetical protein
MVSAAAYADDNTTLTTKNYVDSGLRAVYQAANTGLATKADASTVSALQTAVEGKADTSTVNTALAGKADASTVTALSNVVNGDGENNGLVQTVANLKAAVESNDYSSLATKVTDLENIVGDSESGLVNQVSTLETALNGENGLNNKVSTLQTTVSGKADASTVTALSNVVNGDGENDGLVQKVSALQTTVADKANQSDLTALTNAVSGEGGLTSQVSALQETVTGKADAATVAALQETVAGKADTSTVTTLQETVAGKADASTVSTLQTTVGQLQSAVENVNYTGENGVAVNNETRKIGFAIENAVADTPYVYQNGTWSALETVNEWNPSILN